MADTRRGQYKQRMGKYVVVIAMGSKTWPDKKPAGQGVTRLVVVQVWKAV